MPKDKKSKAVKEEAVPEPALPSPEDSEEEPAPKPASKKAAAFQMLADSDDDAQDEDGDLAMFGKKKKKKDKKDKDDAENGDDSKKKKKKKDADEEENGKKDDDEKKKKKSKKTPVVGEVIEVKPVPKKEKLRLAKVKVGQDEVEIVTNAPNVHLSCAGKRFIVALPGVTTASGIEVKVAKVGGVESSGMFCGPKEMGWSTDVLDEELAVMLSDSAESGTPAPSYEDAVAALQEREKAAAAAKEEAKGKKGKKGKNAQQDDEDIDALLAEFKDPNAPEPEETGKKGKKKDKGKQKAADNEDFDAALNEAKAAAAEEAEEKKEPAPTAAPAAAPVEDEAVDAKTLANRKKKDKKKAKAGGGADDDDFDAALNDFKEDAPPAAASSSAAPAAPALAPKEEPKDEEVDAKTLANRKKKEKEKAKKAQQKAGGEGLWADDSAPTPSASSAPAPEAEADASPAPEAEKPVKGKAKEKASAKKETAAVKAARERMEAQKKLDEERRAFEEAEKKRIEEEERKEREEEEAREAERQRKRDAKAAKIAKQKAEGTFMSKNEKARAQRAKELREQFGFSMNDGDEEEEEAKPVEAAPKKRPLASTKKKKPTGKKEVTEDTEAAEEDKTEAIEEKEVKAEPPKKADAKTAEADDDDEDDWEKEAEKKEEEEAAKADESEDEAGSDKDSDEDSKSGSGSDSDSDSDSSSDIEYRSPIVCIMGHVDTGKTKLLDKIRRTNVQEGEAGGITQQIGATFFPDIALMEQTKKVDPDFDIEVPGLLIIDTPGHESFNNLRTRGASLCDMAILVIDIMHGLEPQTVESLELLKKRRCPFIIAMNKIDVLYQWQSKTYTGVREALGRQEQFVRDEFRKRFDTICLHLNERGLNVALYWENDEPKSTVSIVPTSALTGEGVPDLLYGILNLTQGLLSSKIEVEEELQCTVIEVKNIEGLGTTIDVVLVNGCLREGDQIVLAGMTQPIVTTIRALLTPQPMKEMRVKNEYVHHAKIDKSMGVKICAPELDQAVAGTELKVVGPDDDIEDLKDEVQESFESILQDFEKQTEGVYVKASTLGSLEALLSFLETDMKIPVFDVGIGEVHKKDVKRAMIMKEKSHPEYAVILAFDVPVNKEAKIQADKDDVQIMTADIIYHLQDKFKAYMDKVQESRKKETQAEVVFPVMLQIDKQCVFRKKDPLIVGVDIIAGQLRVGTPLCVPEKDNLEIGRVGGIEKDKKPVTIARRGDRVCVKIEQNTSQTSLQIGRHFEVENQLYSKISRQSIDVLKENFRSECEKEDWELVKAMKQVFNII